MRLSLLRRKSRGQTLVEFALILPIFVLLLVGIFDFGRAIYAYNTISNAAREAVRVAIVVWPWGSYLGDEGVKHGIRVKTSSYQRFHVNTLMTKATAVEG